MFRRLLLERQHGKLQAGAKTIAVLFGFESVARATLSSLYPILLYRSLNSAEKVSHVYFLVGLSSLTLALFMPLMLRRLPRQWINALGITMLICAPLLAVFGGDNGVVAAIFLGAFSAVVLMICMNSYIMDYVPRHQLGHCESQRMFFCAAAWTAGPFVGVWLADTFGNAVPFILTSLTAVLLMVFFRLSGLGNGKYIVRKNQKPPNILLNVFVFLRQPRLVSGWCFSVLRSIGWFCIFVYVPIYAIEVGWGQVIGGLLVSVCNAFLFATPLILRWMTKRSVRKTIMTSYFGASIFFSLTVIFWDIPVVAAAALVSSAFFLVMLDVCGNLPFLMAVKPSQRTDMAAVFSTYRDASSFIAPGIASVVLVVLPISSIFAVLAGMMGGGFWLGQYLHPRLGKAKELVEQPA